MKEQHDEAVSRIMRFLPPEAVHFDRNILGMVGTNRESCIVTCVNRWFPIPCSARKPKAGRLASESTFPYEYGSDLHWLWGWGERLRSLLSDDLPPSKHDWMVFRPDRLARDAMMRFSIKYPHIIKQIDDYLDFADARFDDFLSDDNDSTRADFAGAMESLCERIRVGVEQLHEWNKLWVRASRQAGSKSSSGSDQPTGSGVQKTNDSLLRATMKAVRMSI